MEGLGELWNLVFFNPMVNGLVLLSWVFWGSLGLGIVVFTLLIRLIILPLTLQQLRATKKMSQVQPKLLELQKKYGKDRQRMAQEQMRLYREAGISPSGCMLPMLVQFPVWIALYQAVIRVLPTVPEQFLALSRHLYSWEIIQQRVPLEEGFLWLNLALSDRIYVLPVLVGVTMWAQQKMITTAAADPRQASMNRMMLWFMPVMFAWFTLQFPSGLALYWVVSNLVGIIIQYFVGGWGGLLPSRTPEKGTAYGKPGVQRQDRGRSRPARPGGARAKKGGGRDSGAQEGQAGGPGAGE